MPIPIFSNLDMAMKEHTRKCSQNTINAYYAKKKACALLTMMLGEDIEKI